MLVAVIADTHLPKGSRRLPDRCVELIRGADALIHAGDVSTAGELEAIRRIGPPVHAVHGNVDDAALRSSLPAELVLEFEGRGVAVVHDAGPRRGRLERLAGRFPDAEAAIFGHSHLPLHELRPGFQIFNPGSPTERRRAPSRSMGLMRISPTGVDFEPVLLG